MKRKKIALVLALTITIGLFSGCSKDFVLTGDKIVKQQSDHLTVQGDIETKEININSKAAGKITAIKVAEGDSIKNGQVLITIDNSSLVAKEAQSKAQIDAATEQMKAAQAAKSSAQAQLQKAQNGARPEEIDEAKSQYDLAKSTYDRINALYSKGYAAKEDLDKAQTDMDVAQNQYNVAKDGSRPEDIAALQAQVSQADATIQGYQAQIKQAEGGQDEVQSYINDTTITAPADGVVNQLNVEVGELVSTGMPLLVMTNTVAPWVECDIKETDLSKVKLNEEVPVKIPAYPNQKFKGKIVRINKDADFAVKRATNDNGDFDIVSYGIKVELIDMNKPLHAGMTAFVDFGKK
ncbi:HlyD family secretion protein [Clostridium coskatii]|uniref:Multidrug resistance protein EmrK n=1 Tax=Clostridium coskatii TaxID=1705578 RepID=A0A168R5Q3_9CLOT|nr:efflux RND transporter periplasmic adaptor subunit [Clostridium coskatii]OAA90079.1 putative multidrug resistance protein EmrK [Clostridium coskatii]OBR92721.1 putative multidrug resistance protein EmrK [Clostridium coskatii]